MKFTTILSLLILLCMNTLTAQDSDHVERPYILGGQFSFSINENTGIFPISPLGSEIIYINFGKSTLFNLSPYIAKRVNHNWYIGLTPSFSYYRTKGLSFVGNQVLDHVRKTTQLGLGVMSRYMFNPEDKFVVFLSPYASFNTSTTKDTYGESPTSDKLNTIGVDFGSGLGIFYKVTDRWNITTRLLSAYGRIGNREYKSTNADPQDYHSFGLTTFINGLNIGAEYRF